jgi:hypothetical protein
VFSSLLASDVSLSVQQCWLLGPAGLASFIHSDREAGLMTPVNPQQCFQKNFFFSQMIILATAQPLNILLFEVGMVGELLSPDSALVLR